MSVKLSCITVTDHSRLKSVVQQTFDLSVPRGWVLVKYTGPTTIALQASAPNGTIPDLVSKLDDDQIQYALVRLPAITFGGVEGTPKDIFVTWVGPKVGKIERGKKSEHLQDLKTVLEPSHTDLTALTKNNFTEQTLRELSDPSSGTHVLKPMDQQTDQETYKATVAADQVSRQQHDERIKKQGQEKAKKASVAVASVGGADRKLSVITITNGDKVDLAVQALLDKTNVKGWVLVRYTSPTHLELQQSGFGNISELHPHLEDNQIQYALIRLPAEPVTKDIFITWIGPKVSKIEQAKKTEHLADLKSVLGPSHGHLIIFTKVNFNEAKVRELADPSSGTHILKDG